MKTIIKRGKHYCPKCKTISSKCLRVIDIDVKKREIGAKLGHPEFGVLVKCKCGWQGEFKIESKAEAKLNKLWNDYCNSKKVRYL